MSREILQDIIDGFSPDKFTRFFREKNRSFAPRQESFTCYNDEYFSDGIKLGEIKFSESEKVIVCAFKANQPLSERSGKKAQYEKGKKILRDTQSDAGIFIFYDQTGNFRFSLIYPETIGSRRQWSSFRRFTYFVSREFTNKTFLQRIGDNEFSSIEKIKDAFSVEKVTKEFYLEYRKLFESLVKDLLSNHTFINEAAKNDINTENFAKKLLGQIVFIYFIQKKGWMGVPAGQNWGVGDKNFLINQFKEAIGKKSNFFNGYLESLFYGTLNNPRRNSADPSFSKDFNCRIPFLNGGLFEAEYDWKNSFIYLDNNIFKNVFDVFERFNFTVEEESPDDKEIAVDPEMLGKVFENLLAENLRKGTGTYYTPREIVYYMCQESLINYLDANSKLGKDKVEKCVKSLKEGEKLLSEKEAGEMDNLLEAIKICDPACGSGAFLVGMLNEIVRLRLLLRLLCPSKLSKKSEYQLKKDTIHNCIYGVDIDPGAIEIAKLRLWLMLVVDYEIREIEPLPNLDYRLMCGNSLLDEFEGVRFYNGDNEKQDLDLFKDTKKQEKIAELKKKVEEYFDIHDDEEKRSKRKEINDIKDWLIKTALEKRRKELASHRKSEEAKLNMFDEENRKKYFSNWGTKFLAEAKINEVLRNLHDPSKAKPFFIWKLEFIDVFEDKGGFDVVIANPPYDVYQGHRSGEIDEIRKYSLYEKASGGKLNAYKLFLAKSADLQKQNGVLCEIFQNSFLGDSSSSKIRQYFLRDQRIIKIDSFPERDDVNLRVFESAKMSVCILTSQNNKLPVYDFSLSIWRDKYMILGQKIVLSNQDLFGLDPENASIPMTGEQEFNILKKLSVNPRLKEFARCYEGEINLTFHKKFLTREKRKHAPMIKGAAVQKWFIKEKMSQGEIEYLDKNKYLKENTGKKSQHHELGRIVMQGITGVDEKNRLKMALVEAGIFCGNSVNYILVCDKKISYKFLLALLNSRLLNWYFKMLSTNSNVNGYEVDNFPMPTKKDYDANAFIEIVEKVLKLAGSADYLNSVPKQSKVNEYERKIDQMVYKLYGLTKEEIQIIERSGAN